MTVFVHTRDIVREEVVLAVLCEAGVRPILDVDHSGDGVPLRILKYPLPVSVTDAAEVIRKYFRSACGLDENAGLEFRY